MLFPEFVIVIILRTANVLNFLSFDTYIFVDVPLLTFLCVKSSSINQFSPIFFVVPSIHKLIVYITRQ